MSSREDRAIKKYYDHINNSGIHCNRFPGWGEMSQAEREEWMEPEGPMEGVLLSKYQCAELVTILEKSSFWTNIRIEYKTHDGVEGLYAWVEGDLGKASPTLIAGKGCRVD